MNTGDIFGIVGGIIVSAVIIAAYVRMSKIRNPTLDDVMNNPEAFFNGSQWDRQVGVLVLDEAFSRANELCDGSHGFVKVVCEQEDLIWDILNKKLISAQKEN